MSWVKLLSLLLLLWNTSYSTPTWLPFEEAVKFAYFQKKYILIDFYADWCGFCKQMDQTTFKNTLVLQEIKENFVSIKIDVESQNLVTWNKETVTQKELSDHFQINQLPTFLFGISKDSNELEIIGQFSSFVQAKKMHELLVYISSGSREKGLSFDQFKVTTSKL